MTFGACDVLACSRQMRASSVRSSSMRSVPPLCSACGGLPHFKLTKRVGMSCDANHKMSFSAYKQCWCQLWHRTVRARNDRDDPR